MEVVPKAIDTVQYSQLEVNRDSEYPEAVYPQLGDGPEKEVTGQYRDHSSRGSFWRRKRLWALLGALIVAALVGGVVGGILEGKHHDLPKRYVKLQKDIEIAGSRSAIGCTNLAVSFRQLQ
jgi:hypothetical protein